MKKINKAAKKYYNSLVTKKRNPSPGINDYVILKYLKLLTKNAKNFFPVDHAFYREKDSYFYDTKVGIITRIIGRFAVKMIIAMTGSLAPAQEMKDRRAYFKPGTISQESKNS